MTHNQFLYSGILKEIARLQNEMSRVFEDFPVEYDYPPINIWNNADNVLVHVEVPGLTAEQLDVTVSGETLTVSGERKAEQIENAVWHRRERKSGRFSKTIRLPFPVEADKVQAKLEQGILRLELPRSEADKPRKIAVKTA